MTLAEIRSMAMFQSNNDEEDLGEFQPNLDDYINEGYDKLAEAYNEGHLEDESGDYFALTERDDEPNLPVWCHRAIADYATYMIYRNGNVTKQNRAVPYMQAFMEMLGKVRSAGSKRNGKLHFYNLYSEG